MRKFLGRLVLATLVVLGLWYVIGHYTDGPTFGCDAGPHITADDPGDCPPTVFAAEADPQWATQRWATIRTAKVTTGLFYDRDGAEHLFTSGADADARHAADVLRVVGAAASPLGTYPAASHVEIKAAVRMRDVGETQGVLVINNPTGPCVGILSCGAALDRVLPPGSTLVVWWPDSRGMMRQRRFGPGDPG